MRVHVVHDGSGRILALAPVEHLTAEGVRLGATPVPAEGQTAIRLTLAEEHLALGPDALLRDYEVDVDGPRLRPRS